MLYNPAVTGNPEVFMCGIIGMVGDRRDVAPILFEGLKQLESRGYASAGLAVIRDGAIHRRRVVGRVEGLAPHLDSLADVASFGIAPAVLMYNLPYPSQARLPIFIIFSLCSALRLARYNVQAAQEM